MIVTYLETLYDMMAWWLRLLDSQTPRLPDFNVIVLRRPGLLWQVAGLQYCNAYSIMRLTYDAGESNGGEEGLVSGATRGRIEGDAQCAMLYSRYLMLDT